MEDMLTRVVRADQQNRTACITEGVEGAIEPQTQMVAAALHKFSQHAVRNTQKTNARPICFRCGQTGHHRRCTCIFWCDKCESNTHTTVICHCPGNGQQIVCSCAKTTVAAVQLEGSWTNTEPPQGGASASIWKQQLR